MTMCSSCLFVHGFLPEAAVPIPRINVVNLQAQLTIIALLVCNETLSVRGAITVKRQRFVPSLEKRQRLVASLVKRQRFVASSVKRQRFVASSVKRQRFVASLVKRQRFVASSLLLI